MLEEWDADWLEEEKKNGRTRPLVIHCSRSVTSEEGEEADENVVSNDALECQMLVKVQNNEVTERHLFAEVYGNLLAREFGVSTAQPALIRISPEFVESLKMTDIGKHLTIAPGIAVGCEYIKGMSPIALSASRNNEELADIQAIYGVDLLSQNPDRRPSKTNCASFQGGILAYDFELSFSFLWPIFGVIPAAWAVHEQGINKGHLFYQELKRRQMSEQTQGAKGLDWKPFLTILQSLTPEKLSTYFKPVFPEWANYAEQVKTHIGEIRTNIQKFEDALIWVSV